MDKRINIQETKNRPQKSSSDKRTRIIIWIVTGFGVGLFVAFIGIACLGLWVGHAEVKELEEKLKNDELVMMSDVQSIYDEDLDEVFENDYWVLPFLTYESETDEFELESIEGQYVYETYKAAGLTYSKINEKLAEEYWDSFELMADRLGISEAKDAESIGELALLLAEKDDVELDERYELMARYANSIYYDANTKETIYKEQADFVEDALNYQSATTEELFIMAGALNALSANMNRDLHPEMDDVLSAGDEFYQLALAERLGVQSGAGFLDSAFYDYKYEISQLDVSHVDVD